MSDDAGATSCSVWEPAALHPCILKRRDTVDSIEKTKKADGLDRTAKRLSEGAHVLELFMLF